MANSDSSDSGASYGSSSSSEASDPRVTDTKQVIDPKATSSKVATVQAALRNRDPFYTGMCALRDHQRILYYTDGNLHRRIDFSNASLDELDTLYRACKPAEFGRNGENVLDPSYRKAGKIDPASFSAQFDSFNLGIYQQVSNALLHESHACMDLELYKLNVYGKGDFFKAHRDTPRGVNMFASLVVVLPTAHEGGQLVFRQAQKEWTVDFTEDFAATKAPSACFVAFYSDLEHEVLPVTSGYRVTLTYNLYKLDNTIGPSTSLMPTPFHVKLQEALCELVNDKTTLPDGGYLGFGLVHEYPHLENDLLGPLPGQLKGADRALVDVCNTLDLGHSFRMFYRQDMDLPLNLLSTFPIDISDTFLYDDYMSVGKYLEEFLSQGTFTTNDVEGVLLVGEKIGEFDEIRSGLESVCKEPITEVLEVTKMRSSVSKVSSVATYGNNADVGYLYGSACLVVALEPAEARRVLHASPWKSGR